MDPTISSISGSHIFHEMMRKHEVKAMFGYNGAAVLSIFDAIYNSPYFDFVLSRHEQWAGHMAEGYARASGKPGVVLVTSGPGSSNTVTPILDGLMDGTPMVIFCGQVAQKAIGTGAFQEIPIESIMRPCVKWCVMVERVEDMAPTITKAFQTATGGRPGPVVVIIPKDVSSAQMTLEEFERSSEVDTNDLLPSPQVKTLESVARLLNISKRPVILAGQGVIQSPSGVTHLKRLAEKATIPVATTIMGLGCFDEEDPKSLRWVGQHGAVCANLAIQDADLVLVLGARLDDRVTGDASQFGKRAREAARYGMGGIVHFDIHEPHLNKVVQCHQTVQGDVGDLIAHLLPFVKEQHDRDEWFGKLSQWKLAHPFHYTIPADGLIPPQALIEELGRQLQHLKSDSLITTGVGQHQMWAAQYYRSRHPRTMIMSGSLGTMGFGLPAAIGAKVARPDATVIDIDGDASFCMSMEELVSAQQAGVNIKIILVNNDEQGMISEYQTRKYHQRYSHSQQRNPDFCSLAKSMGAGYQACNTLEDLSGKVQWLLKNSSTSLLEVKVMSKVNLLPVVEAGRPLHEPLILDAENNIQLLQHPQFRKLSGPKN